PRAWVRMRIASPSAHGPRRSPQGPRRHLSVMAGLVDRAFRPVQYYEATERSFRSVARGPASAPPPERRAAGASAAGTAGSNLASAAGPGMDFARGERLEAAPPRALTGPPPLSAEPSTRPSARVGVRGSGAPRREGPGRGR